MLPTIVCGGTAATEELDPEAPFEPFGFLNRDEADFPRRGDVGPAAGGEIEVADRDDPERSGHIRRLTKGQPAQLLLRREPRANQGIAADDFVREGLRIGDERLWHSGNAEVNGDAFGSQVKADGWRVSDPQECLGEHVLAAVLLHVIQPPHGVDRTVESLPRGERACALDHMVNSSGFIFEDIDDRSSAERSDIVRLASAGRIKSGLVQHDTMTPFVRLRIYDCGGEFEQAGVAKVEFCGWFHF